VSPSITLVNSHIHFDHADGNARLPRARLVVQRAEGQAAAAGDAIRMNSENPKDRDIGHDVPSGSTESRDLLRDGRVVWVATLLRTPARERHTYTAFPDDGVAR
jgi:glyoxylase-like metal-dependent hydrolase (beta-lactamase superfamily II)